MKKKIITSLLFLMLYSGYSQIQIGFGTITNQPLPFNAASGYSYCQSIYLASEINASGNITSLQWYYNGTGDLSNSQDLIIYLGATSKSDFGTDKNGWIPLADGINGSNLTKVFAGTIVTNSTPGWKTINIEPSFFYDGINNLVVAVEENTPGANTSTDRFYNTSVTKPRTIIYYNSNTDPDPTGTLPLASSLLSYIPDIILGGISQECPTPTNLVVSNLGTTTATVSWISPGTHPANGSDYYLSTSDVPPTDSTTPIGNEPTNNFVNLTNLTPETNYYFWVKNNCGNGTLSKWSVVASFKTNCVSSVLFAENFDSVTAPKLPSCWSYFKRGSGVSIAATTVVTATAYSFSSPNSLRLSNYSSEGEYEIVAVSPPFSNVGAGTNRLRFYAQGTQDAILQIGTVSNNTNTATFNLIESVLTLSGTLKSYTIDFSGYNGTDAHIGFRIIGPQQSVINIDNVSWEKIPICPDVSNVKITEIGFSTASVGWTSGGTELMWDIAYGEQSAGTNPDLLTIKSTDTDGYYEITGLNGTTTYQVWVRSHCSETDRGVWIGPALFTTTCTALDNFHENFDSVYVPQKPVGGGSSQVITLPYCWSKIRRANTSNLLPGTEIYTSKDIHVSSLPNSVFLYNYGSTGDFDLILVSPPVSNLSLGNHRLRFFAQSKTVVQIGTLNNNTDSATFNLIETVTTTNGVHEYIVDFSKYNGSDKYIGIRYAYQQYGGAALDDIVWEQIPNCAEVSNITVPQTTVSNAVITWSQTQPANETSWQVVVGPTSATSPDALPIIDVNGATEVAVGNLNSGTSYKTWVRAVCANTNEYGAWIGPVAFSTECPPVESFMENFNSAPAPNLPVCWTKILRGSPEYLSPYASISTGGGRVNINIQGSSNMADLILVSPNISTLGQPYRLKFDSAYPGVVEIGTLDNNTPSAVFTVFKTVTLPVDMNNGYGGKTVVDFSTFSGVIRNYNHIGIRLVQDGSLPSCSFDNITWEPVPPCSDVTQIKVPSITPTSADIIWSAGTGNSSWQVVASADPNANPNTLTPYPATNSNLTIPNLEPDTNYQLWVRSLCAEGYGSWIGPVSFKTLCLAVNTPYVEDFESAIVAQTVPTCTIATTDGNGSYWQVSSTGTGSMNMPTKINRCYPSATDTNAWFYTRGINLEADQNYSISYKKGTSSPIGTGVCSGYCGPNNLKVTIGNLPNPSQQTTTLANYVSLVGPYTTEDAIPFTVPASGVYYFGFNTYSSGNHGSVAIDDIKIDGTLNNDYFDVSKFKYYPNPVKDNLNISYANDIETVSVYNLFGQLVLTQTIHSTTATVDMSAFTSGTYLVKIASGNTVKTIKVIKE